MPFRVVAQKIENGINRRGIVRLRKRGWLPRVIPFVGYGSTRSLHVLARVIMADSTDQFNLHIGDVNVSRPHLRPSTRKKVAKSIAAQTWLDPRMAILESQRGWRQFFTTQVGFIEVTVQAGEQEVVARTNQGGYLDILIENHGLEPGWHTVKIIPQVGEAAVAQVLIVGDEVRTGIISDIDDTVMVTVIPRALLAFWNSWVRHSSSRKPVEGMADLYRYLVSEHPGTPVVYLSTGAWNTLPTLQIFLRKHGFPRGPMLLTDWGPQPTGLFRSGPDHKRVQIRNLFLTFPNIRWLLVGDNGQHDPLIYSEVSAAHSRHVEAIAIRELSATEQVLTHGTLDSLDPEYERQAPSPDAPPVFTAPNGYGLLGKMRRKLWRSNPAPIWNWRSAKRKRKG